MLGVGIDWAEEFHVVALGRPGEGVIEVVRVEHLRRPFPGIALTCGNVLAEVLPGRVSGAARLPGRLGPVVRVRGARRPALRRRSLRAVSRRAACMRTTG